MQTHSPFACLNHCLLAVVAVTALAATTLAQSPPPVGAGPTPLASDLLAHPLTGAAAGGSLTPPAGPRPPRDVPPWFDGPCLERSKLTGDWRGCRADLSDHGITFDISTTQFYQGVSSGGLERSPDRYDASSLETRPESSPLIVRMGPCCGSARYC